MARTRKKRRPVKKLNRTMRAKLIVLFAAFVLLLCGLIGVLTYIESTSGDKYEKKVLSMQSYDSKTIPYQRGNIIDSSGTVLATSEAVYNVILDCSQMTYKEDYVEPTIQALLQCFPELKEEDLRTYAKDKKDSKYIVLAKKLPYDEIQKFVELQDKADEKGNKVNPNIKGVWFEKEYQRTYPYKSLAASVIGFTSSGNVGTTGLENYYDDTLNGVNGREYGYLNSDSNFEKTVIPAQDGNNLVISIDSNIQSVVEQKIQEFNDAYRDNYYEGDGSVDTAVIIQNPQNGEILAMADYPEFDLNNPRDLSSLYSKKELKKLSDDDTMDILNNLWQNYCVTATYEPGSVQKPFTVASGLETGTLNDKMTFVCDGGETFNGQKVSCVNRNGHGTETVRKALMDSCNDALMQMSYKIGKTNFHEYQPIFGFGQKTGIDLPGEAATIMHKRENIGLVELATISFGQSFQITPIQLAATVSSIINGGNRVTPHFGVQVEDASGNCIEKFSYEQKEGICSSETSEKMRYLLEKVVSEGGGNKAYIEGYSIGGKTATSQTLPRSANRYISSFLGFAPADDPQVLVLVIIRNPSGIYYGGTIAAPVAKEIFENILPYLELQ